MSENRKYNISVANYSTSQRVNVIKGCNAFAAVNLGDTIAEINGVPIFPSATPATIRGDVFGIAGNENEVYRGNIQLSFRTPLGAAPLVAIVQQFYTDQF